MLRTCRRACKVPCLPSVITRSTQRRSSLALGSVVRIFSSRSKAVIRLRINAQRWLELRLSCLPDLRWRMVQTSDLLLLFVVFPRLDLFSRRKVIDLHAELKPHFLENFLNFIQRFMAEILGPEHLLFRLLH